ncbi:DUF3429 domain-containing protein [Falsiroseomonas bella]|uniref:DUF3429 domain-containing protein n=1 Tax=Falsiroseomonas bella TaxID=2184016 RepID=A0A317FB88_9PROT|nr:DUF3429 domain-containing protein [Falsiroseomonas bella]PWS36334.1 DUF3429 domain-containing protein [Falsiroseomonas bella]
MTDTALPAPTRPLGLAGLIPFLGLAAAALAGWPPAAEALAAYGATILAFLGAVHWGLALRAPPAEQGAAAMRLGLGVVPALVAWVALLLPVPSGLILLTLGILATAGVETLGGRAGLVGQDYLRLRWLLSACAAGALLLGAVAA